MYKKIELQMSCGWCSVDLDNLTKSGNVELPLNGGMPSVSTQIHNTDVRTGRGTLFGKMGKLFGGNIKSELKIVVGLKEKVKAPFKTALDLLPRTCIVPTESLYMWRAYRCYAGRYAYPGGDINSSLGTDIIIRTFLRIVNVPTFSKRLCGYWNQVGEPHFHNKVTGQVDYEAVIDKFEEVMNITSPVFEAQGFRFNKTDQTMDLYGRGAEAQERESVVMDALSRARQVLQGDLRSAGNTELKYDRAFAVSDLLEDEFDQIGGM